MLLHPTLEKLNALRLTGMAAALHEQRAMAAVADLGFEERLGLLLDREQAVRDTRRMHTRLRKARLRQEGVIEDICYRPPIWSHFGIAVMEPPRDRANGAKSGSAQWRQSEAGSMEPLLWFSFLANARMNGKCPKSQPS